MSEETKQVETTSAPPVKAELSVRLEKAYEKMFSDGRLINLNIGKWSMTHTLDKDDLNVAEVPSFITLGKKYLIEDEARWVFQRIESAARTYLMRHSYPFPVAEVHFVPKKNYLKVIDELERCKAMYYAAVDTFIATYPVLMENFLSKHNEHRSMLVNCYPPAHKLRDKFSYNYTTFELTFPKKLKGIDVDQIVANEQNKQEAIRRLEEDFRRQMETQYQQAEGFIFESITLMQREVTTTVQAILTRISDKKMVSETNIKSLMGMIENFKTMSFLPEGREIHKNIEALEKVLQGNAEFKDKGSIGDLQTSLRGVLSQAETLAVQATTEEYFSGRNLVI